MGEQPMTTPLLPCPFCGGKMILREALWPSEGDVDGIIHTNPTDCPLRDFSVGLADHGASVIAAWNRRTPTDQDTEIARLRSALEFIRDYPPVGGRRTADGYPSEIIYDEFAYRRIVDSYREGAARALAAPAEARDE